MIKNGLLFFCFLCVVQFGFSQTEGTDAAHIKTIILKPVAINTYAPIVRLGEKIQLTFDDLNADEHTYTYFLINYTLQDPCKPGRIVL